MCGSWDLEVLNTWVVSSAQGPHGSPGLFHGDGIVGRPVHDEEAHGVHIFQQRNEVLAIMRRSSRQNDRAGKEPRVLQA